MRHTDSRPDDLALDVGNRDDIIAWAIVKRRLIFKRGWYGHPSLISHFFDACHVSERPKMNNSGYVLNDNKIVAWIEPTVKQLDILWKEFGCLDVEYHESLATATRHFVEIGA